MAGKKPLRLIDWVKQFDRRPIVPLAGYPGSQLTHSTIKQNMFNAELQARSIYKLVEKTNPDAVFAMMDLSVEAGALGLPVRFPLGESATVEWHPVKRVDDLEQFKVVDPMFDGRVWAFLETVRQLYSQLDMPIGAYVSGPFTLAGLMIGANDIAIATIENPEVVLATVNFCEQVIIEYAKALQEAGAGIICILDPTAVILSPKMYWDFAGRSSQNVIRHLHAMTIMHICGNTEHLTEKMCMTGAHGLSLDSLVDMPKVAGMVPDDIVVMGNVNPVTTLLQGNRQKVRDDTIALLDAMKEFDNFILSTGCDLPPETPMENIVEFVETGLKYGR